MADLLRLALGALVAHRLRSFLSMLGIAIGVAAVILLTSIGEGTRVYVLGQFTQFGTNIIAVNPGKSKTLGIPGVLGGTTRKLTIDDAEALARIPGIETMVPVTMGLGARRGRRARAAACRCSARPPTCRRCGSSARARARSGRRATRAAAARSPCSGPSSRASCSATEARSARWCASPAGASA